MKSKQRAKKRTYKGSDIRILCIHSGPKNVSGFTFFFIQSKCKYVSEGFVYTYVVKSHYDRIEEKRKGEQMLRVCDAIYWIDPELRTQLTIHDAIFYRPHKLQHRHRTAPFIPPTAIANLLAAPNNLIALKID